MYFNFGETQFNNVLSHDSWSFIAMQENQKWLKIEAQIFKISTFKPISASTNTGPPTSRCKIGTGSEEGVNTGPPAPEGGVKYKNSLNENLFAWVPSPTNRCAFSRLSCRSVSLSRLQLGMFPETMLRFL
jgi:hypothetical protein